jgi:4-amino-4-deoxy-L-arabinose transferase-like glycosyltransferase
MPISNPEEPVAESQRRWHRLAAVLILGITALRIWYLTSLCTLDLAPDEAHYWDWSRHPDWSYYSKGPAVAYLIRAATFVSERFCVADNATSMIAVRLPAVVCGGLLLLALYILTVQIYRSARLGLTVVAVTSIMPIASAGSLIMTIDAPYCCCWGWALVCGYRAIFRDSSWAWAAAGLLVGAGILAKQTMVLFLPGMAIFLLANRDHRWQLARPGFWLMVSIAGLCSLPIVIWNAQHDWVTFRHVGGQAGVIGSEGIRWLGPVYFVGMQFALLLGYWFVTWVVAMCWTRPWTQTHAPTQYLWWMSATVFAVFFLFSLKAEEQPNWPVTAYISGLVLGTACLLRHWQTMNTRWKRLSLAGLALACTFSVSLTVLLLHSEWIRPQLAALAKANTEGDKLPIRQFDPTCRLRGWQMLAAEVDRLREELLASGTQPVLAASGWTLPGELGFYCAGHPTVYSLGLSMGDRHSQYDFWRPNPVMDARQFEGCTMIVVGPPTPLLFEAFETIEQLPSVTYEAGGCPMARWNISICRGYRGFPEKSGRGRRDY